MADVSARRCGLIDTVILGPNCPLHLVPLAKFFMQNSFILEAFLALDQRGKINSAFFAEVPKTFWSEVTEKQLVEWLPLVKNFSTGKSIKNAFLQSLAGYKIQSIENGTKLKKAQEVCDINVVTAVV